VLPIFLSPQLGGTSSIGSVMGTVVASYSVPSREGDLDHYPRKFGKYHLLAPLAQ
jgi:hypothetical protein